MKNKKLEANLSMAVSKIFSGLNMNALKYLLPLWMSPLTGATLRCTFAAAAFWMIGWFMPPEKSSAKDKWLLFLSKGCKFKHLKNVVANYYENGISARNTELREKERKTILDKYFINSYKTAETIRFLGIPIIRIKKSRDNKKYKIVFLKIPVFVGKTNL